MRKIMVLAFSIMTLAIISLHFSSCGKEISKAPIIFFDTAAIYISADTVILHHTAFTLGVKAAKTGSDGMLSSFRISRSTNSGPDSTIQEMNFVQQYFLHYYSYLAGDSGNTERYTFTITEQDGLSNSVSVSVGAK